MAALSTIYPTLADWAKTLDPDGTTAKIVELLSQSNEILEDMVFKEGNLPTGHQVTVRTGLPTVAWRMMNAGVLPSKSTSAQITEQTGMLEAYSVVDEALAKLNGNAKSYRMSEAMAFVEAMNQEMAGTVFYGNASAPEEFVGLTARYSALSGAANSSHVINAGGASTDNASIWLVNWGAGVFGIFPKGSKAGLSHEDMGRILIQNANGVTGALMKALVDHWEWKAGIALADWRQVVRIANIDISNLVAGSSAANLTELMIKAIHRIPNIKVGRPVFYVNRSVAEMLDIQRRSDVIAGGGLDYDSVDGRNVMKFRGIPIRVIDQLTEAETLVA